MAYEGGAYQTKPERSGSKEGLGHNSGDFFGRSERFDDPNKQNSLTDEEIILFQQRAEKITKSLVDEMNKNEGRDKYVICVTSVSDGKRAEDARKIIENNLLGAANPKNGNPPLLKDVGRYNLLNDGVSYDDIGAKIRSLEENHKIILIFGSRERAGLESPNFTESAKKDNELLDDIARKNGIKDNDPLRSIKLLKLATAIDEYEEDGGKHIFKKASEETIKNLSEIAINFEVMLRIDFELMKTNFPGRKIKMIYVGGELMYQMMYLLNGIDPGTFAPNMKTVDYFGGPIKFSEGFDIEFDTEGNAINIGFRGKKITKKIEE